MQPVASRAETTEGSQVAKVASPYKSILLSFLSLNVVSSPAKHSDFLKYLSTLRSTTTVTSAVATKQF